MNKRLIAGAAGLVILLAACGDDDVEPGEGSSDSVEGRTFLSVDSTNFEIVEGSQISLTFEDGRVGVNAGCNSISGGYVIADGVLQVEQMITTEMACDQALMDQDTRITEFLMAGPQVALDGNDLTLSTEDASIDFQDREVADPDRPVEGTTWKVTGIIDADSVSSVAGEATITINDGVVAVDTGCNTGSGDVTVGEGTLTFGPIGATKMACDEDLMALETHIFAVLDGEVTYEIEADSMTLTNGELGLQLTAA